MSSKPECPACPEQAPAVQIPASRCDAGGPGANDALAVIHARTSVRIQDQPVSLDQVEMLRPAWPRRQQTDSHGIRGSHRQSRHGQHRSDEHGATLVGGRGTGRWFTSQACAANPVNVGSDCAAATQNIPTRPPRAWVRSDRHPPGDRSRPPSGTSRNTAGQDPVQHRFDWLAEAPDTKRQVQAGKGVQRKQNGQPVLDRRRRRLTRLMPRLFRLRNRPRPRMKPAGSVPPDAAPPNRPPSAGGDSVFRRHDATRGGKRHRAARTDAELTGTTGGSTARIHPNDRNHEAR